MRRTADHRRAAPAETFSEPDRTPDKAHCAETQPRHRIALGTGPQSGRDGGLARTRRRLRRCSRISLALALVLALGACTPSPKTPPPTPAAQPKAAPPKPTPPKATQPEASPPKSSPPTASPAPASGLPVIPVQILTEDGPVSVRAEVVDTPPLRQRGLMFRQQLPADRGMLFLFPDERPRAFWMRNTLIPLDMVFIRADRQILGVVHQATPKTDAPRRVPGASQFVLELAGGVAKARGIHAGQQVRFMAPIPAH